MFFAPPQACLCILNPSPLKDSSVILSEVRRVLAPNAVE